MVGEVGPRRGSGLATGPFPRAASRTRRTRTSSGSATRTRCMPGAPGCLPGRRALWLPRRGCAGLRRPSCDGGLEELDESWPRRRSSSATRVCSAALAAWSSATWACSAALAAWSSAMPVAWTAMIASRSRSREGSMTVHVNGRWPGSSGLSRQDSTAVVGTVNPAGSRSRRAGVAAARRPVSQLPPRLGTPLAMPPVPAAAWR